MNPQRGQWRRRFVRLQLLPLCVWVATGCATYHVYQVGGVRELGNQPMTEWKSKTLHSLVWGAVRQDLPVMNCQLGSGVRTNIEEVRIRSNVGATAATILTLGFWRPLQVSWRCAKPAGLRGRLEPEGGTIDPPADSAATPSATPEPPR